MTQKFNCPNCNIESMENFTVEIDDMRVKDNEYRKKEYEEAVKKYEEDLQEYNNSIKKYERIVECHNACKGWFGLKWKVEKYTFSGNEHIKIENSHWYDVTKYPTLYEPKEPWSPTYCYTRYIKCPVCEIKHYIR